MVTCSHYLAVAYFENKLTRSECWEIKQYCDALVSRGLPSMKCGEVAVTLRYLTAPEAERLELSRQAMVSQRRSVPDPLAGTPPPSLRRAWRVRVSVLAYLFAFIIPLTVFFVVPSSLPFRDRLTFTGLSLAVAMNFGVGLMRDIFSRHFREGSVIVSGAAQSVSFLISSLATVYVFWCLWTMLGVLSTPVTESQIHSLAVRAASAFIIVAGSWVFTIGNAQWRKREIRWLQFKDDLQLAIIHLASSIRFREADARQEQVHRVLEFVAAALRSNVYDGLFRLIPFWRRLTAVTVWYLEPVPAADGSVPLDNIEFRIVAVVSPGSSQEVEQALESIRREHRPKWNQRHFDEAMQACYHASTGFNSSRFREWPDRDSFMSLTGWIFTRRQGIIFEQPEECDWLVDGHMNIAGGMPAKVARYLRAASGAGYLVSDGQGNPRGVLLAFRGRTEGMLADDRAVLCTAAHILGASLT